MKLQPLLRPSSEAVMTVCPLELDMLLSVSDATATSSPSTCATIGVCSCTSSVAGFSGEGTWSFTSVTSVDRGFKVKEDSLLNKRNKNPSFVK